MLVDHHCHLDAPDFAADFDGVVARARAAGVGPIVTISTLLRRLADTLKIAEAYPNVFCSVGTHPHYAHRSWTCPWKRSCGSRGTRRSWRSARRVSTTSMTRARREAQAQGFRKQIAAAQASGAAAGDPRPRCRCGHGRDPRGGDGEEAVLGRAALLHERAGAGQARTRHAALHLVLGHPDLQEVERVAPDRDRRAARPAAGGDGRAVPRAGEIPRQAQRAGLRGGDGEGVGQDQGCLEVEIARATTENFFRLYAKTPRAALRPSRPHEHSLHNSGLRLLRWRAARRQRLG